MSDFSILPTPPDAPDGSPATAPSSPSAKTRMLFINPKSFWDRRMLGLLDSGQETMIFDPRPKDVQKLKNPSEYDELRGLNVTERLIATDFDKKGRPTAQITLWEHKGKPDKEHYILFNGKTGHIADIGGLPEGVSGDGYDKTRGIKLNYDRHGGLKFLKELASEGAGFTVVTVRGYGNNLGTPSEEGFSKDLDAFLADRKVQKELYPGSVVAPQQTVIAGVSLGTGIAAMLASKMTEQEGTPAMLALVNPYKRFSAAAEHTLRSRPFKYKPLKGVPFAEDIRNLAFDVPRDVLEKLLRTTFRTDERIEELDPNTGLLTITSGKDSIIPPENSAELMSVGRIRGLRARQCIYEDCGHHNLPIELVAKDIKAAYQDHLQVPKQHYTLGMGTRSDIVNETIVETGRMPAEVTQLGRGKYALNTSDGRKFVLTVPKGVSTWTDRAKQPSNDPDISI